MNHRVPKPVGPGYCRLLKRKFSCRSYDGGFLGRITGQKDLEQDFQGMFSLPDLPVRDALAFPQAGQVRFNIFSGPVFQRFALKETVKVFCPSDIEGRAVWPYPVLLRAPPVGLPKTIALFRVVDIHDFHPQKPFRSSWLDRDQPCYNRRKYYITI